MNEVTVRYDSSAHDELEPVLNVTEVDAEGMPHATFEAFRAFLYDWMAVDANGTWAPDRLSVVRDELVYEDELGTSRWSSDNKGAFILAGWPWWIDDNMRAS